jgi:hypothetical protein
MASHNKRRRIRRKYYAFFLACLASLLGLAIYIVCRHVVPFPDRWLIENREHGKKLFFLGIDVHLQVSFVLGLFFMLISTEKTDRTKLRK